MSSKSGSRGEGLSKDAIREVRSIVEERISDLKRLIDRIREKRYEYFDNADMLALGIVFAIGLALGVAISKKR